VEYVKSNEGNDRIAVAQKGERRNGDVSEVELEVQYMAQ
jgi:hypothetical protein